MGLGNMRAASRNKRRDRMSNEDILYMGILD